MTNNNPSIIIQRLTSPDSPDIPAAAAVLSESFGTDFGPVVFPNGVTPAFLAWREDQIKRYIRLDALGKPYRTYIARRLGDAGEPGAVVAISCACLASKDDPQDDWDSLVPRVIPPREDVDEKLWPWIMGCFNAAKKRAILSTGEERWQELIYLVVSKSAQRTGAGTALLRQVISDGQGKQRMYLITAPTLSARPFYLKNGLEWIHDEELEQTRMPGILLPDKYCVMRWTPSGDEWHG